MTEYISRNAIWDQLEIDSGSIQGRFGIDSEMIRKQFAKGFAAKG